MATRTLGSNATTSLTAVLFKPGNNSGVSAADMATMANLIRDDLSNSHPVQAGAFSSNGLLFVPNRGVLKVLPGDFVGVDATTGWPILVSARAIAAGPWTHT